MVQAPKMEPASVPAFASWYSGSGSTVTSTFSNPGASDQIAAVIVGIAAPTAGKVPFQNYFAPMLAMKRKPTVGWREGYDHRWRRWRRERGLIVPESTIRRAA